MIFVTVGTHEQQFNRLIKEVDKLKKDGVIKEDVIIQSGFSTYIPEKCICKKIIRYPEMIQYIKDARIIITHGGPATFIMPLQIGKIPVVVPRLKKYEEHVNDHQMEFAELVQSRYGNIIVIKEINELKEILMNYDEIINNMPQEMSSNNQNFNRMFEGIVTDLI